VVFCTWLGCFGGPGRKVVLYLGIMECGRLLDCNLTNQPINELNKQPSNHRHPGGRALVTVWATDQEDPRKTINKWTPFGGAAAASAPAAAGDQEEAGDEEEGIDAAERPGSAPTAAAGGAAGGSAAAGDYLVPWHLPFHRAAGAAAAATINANQRAAALETAAAAAAAAAAAVSGRGGAAAAAGGGAAGREEAEACGPPRVDTAKGAVVFQRYYHLFEREELEGLVGSVGGARLVGSAFYDRSNWCAIFEKL
jgi:hypothetical protein